MPAPKTVKFLDVITTVNDMNRNSKDEMTKERSALNTFIEKILMENRRYRGFHFSEKGNQGDRTRRYYF